MGLLSAWLGPCTVDRPRHKLAGEDHSGYTREGTVKPREVMSREVGRSPWGAFRTLRALLCLLLPSQPEPVPTSLG